MRKGTPFGVFLCCVAAVGRPSMALPPQLCSDNATAVTQYLQFTSEHVSFSQAILWYLVEDRRRVGDDDH